MTKVKEEAEDRLGVVVVVKKEEVVLETDGHHHNIKLEQSSKVEPLSSQSDNGQSDDDDEDSVSSGSKSDDDDDDDGGQSSSEESGSGQEEESSSHVPDDKSSGSGSSHSKSSSSEGEEEEGEEDESDDSSSSPRRLKKSTKFWENDPEFYGIRRSHRPRIEHSSTKRKSQSKEKQSKKRKISTSDDDDSSEDDEKIQRSVRTKNNVSYKEEEEESEDLLTDEESSSQQQTQEEEESHVETIERVMDSRVGKKGATGSTTTLYTVQEKGDPNTNSEEHETEKQFLIKWTTWSHLHNTWESLQTLQEMHVKGLKKLDNFCKKEDEQNRWKARANIEDVEYVECQLELQQELVKSYVNPERVIAERISSDGSKQFFIKWESLPYGEATWESVELIKRLCGGVVREFRRREANAKTPTSSSCKFLRTRPKFQTVKEQPEYTKGEGKDLILRDYQLEGLNWLVHSWCKENSVILADEMGLGKTIQTICFLAYLYEHYGVYGPFLLVVPLSTMAAWQKEFGQWAPQMNVVTYLGDVRSRGIIQDYEWTLPNTKQKLKFNGILTTYEIVLKDKQFLSQVSWAGLIVDEAHRLKNQESLLYRTLVDFESNHRLLITGTPLQNSLRELFSLLHFIMPHSFDDWPQFESEHDQEQKKGYSKLHKVLEPFILRRVKKDVEKSLPSKVEQILRVEMTLLQKQYYKWILTRNYAALKKGEKGSASSFLNVVMELKKCCNHASLIRQEATNQDALSQLIKGSGKLLLLDKLLVRLKSTGHRVLIFSQMVMMLDVIAEYLQLRRFNFQRLDGSIKGDMRKQALEHFNAEGSQDFCFLLSTRAGGLGINLATADTVIIFDSDWNPQNDLQAQARAHRIGQRNQVMIYRLVTKNSVEEDIVERAKRKMVLDHLVIQRMDTTGRTILQSNTASTPKTPFNKEELTAILKFGAEELFKEDDSKKEDDCDIDEILRRAETHEEMARPGDELLSAFKVASFQTNEDEVDSVRREAELQWEAIIPEELRLKVEKEEKDKELEKLFLPPRARNNLSNEALNRKAKKRKKNPKKEEEEEDSDESPVKKKKYKKKKKELKFSEALVKKFLKSLKKFPSPLQQIERVIKDSGVEGDREELRALGEMLIGGCQKAIADQKLHPPPPPPPPPQEETPLKKPPKPRGPIFKIHNVAINARTMHNAIEELQCLAKLIPSDEALRKKWTLQSSGFNKFKKAIGLENWTIEQDSRLLIGIYEKGMGAWPVISQDPLIKDFCKEEGKFHKDLQKRADYLCRVLNKQLPLLNEKVKKKEKKKKPSPTEKKERKKKKDTPMHFSANSTPTPIAVLGDLDPLIFNECKEKMRPVKKALKSLDNPDKDLPEKEQIVQTRSCLIQIGKRIEECLGEIAGGEDPQGEGRKREWKSYLWYFVSKFTEFDAKNLYKVYKKAVKKDKPKKKKKKSKKRESSKKSSKKEKSSSSSTMPPENNDSSSDFKYRPNSSRYTNETFEQSFHQNYNYERSENRHYDRDRRQAPQWQQQQPQQQQWSQHDRYNRDYYKYNNARVAPPLNKEEWSSRSDPRLHNNNNNRRYDDY